MQTALFRMLFGHLFIRLPIFFQIEDEKDCHCDAPFSFPPQAPTRGYKREKGKGVGGSWVRGRTLLENKCQALETAKSN